MQRMTWILVAAVTMGTGAVVPAVSPATAGSLQCLGRSATVVGGNANDVLVGSPGNDVFLASSGADVVIGNGGDDVICGGSGSDRLFGGTGDDVISGDNGDDLLVGEAGDDSLVGANGVDRLFGASGNDSADGAVGADRVGGGSGDDAGLGGKGDDNITGGLGTDTATGNEGSDSCSAEAAECERATSTSTGVVNVTLSGAPEKVSGPFSVNVQAEADLGLAVVILEVNGELLNYKVFAPGVRESQQSIQIQSSELTTGGAQIEAMAIDVYGNDATSDPAFVWINHDLGPEGPSVAVALTTPTRLSTLESTLRAMDQPILEFRDQRELPQALAVPTAVTAQAAADGIDVQPAGTSAVGGFYGRDLSIDDQLAMYRALAPIGDPLITAIRFDGPLTTRAQGLLAPLASSFMDVPARNGYELENPPSSTTSRTQQGNGAAQLEKSDLALSRSSGSGPVTVAAPQAAAVDTRVFWPSYGQFDTTEFSVRVQRRFWPDATYKRVQFDHDLVWAPGVPNTFASLDRAYEHDFKIKSNRLTLGRRPLCLSANPLLSWSDAFYAYREDGVYWESNVPQTADPYFDTDLTDECGTEDLSVGIRKPEVLDDGRGSNQATAYHFRVVTARGEPRSGKFDLLAQRLTRRGDTFCSIVGTANCTGLDVRAGTGGPILRSSGDLISGITVPDCFTWHWPPVGSQASNQSASRCNGDQDGDGWDDSVDCAPNDPTINPGAVDTPNDSIDQNCDGSDLIVGSGTLQFTLIWDNDNDQDLHVYEPGGTHIWYGSRGPTATGGRLDRDDNVGQCGTDPEPGGVENTYWPAASPAPVGIFTIQVQQYANCGTPARWTLEIRDGGRLVQRTSGTTSGSLTYTRSGTQG